MKLLYTLSAAALFCTTAMAQIPANKYSPAMNRNAGFEEAPLKPHHVVNEKVNVLWTNDFSNPADWTFSNTSQPNADWFITTNLNSAPVAAFRPAGFATAANGYAIIDSDALGGAATQDAYLIYNAPITACSASAVVNLRFSQMHRRYLETTSVEVSNDGTNWTTFEVNANMATNTNTSNPASVIVNITSVAANQANVYIRFHYVGAWDWFWAIDDIQIVEPDNYDLAGRGIYAGVEGNFGARLPYFMTPLAQIAPIKVAGIVENIGAMNQSDVVVNGVVPSSFAGSSAPSALASFGLDTFDLTTDWTPTASLGIKTMSFAVTSSNPDASPADNTMADLSVEITDHVYARDTKVRVSGYSDQGDAYELGTVFDMTTADTVYALDIDIHPNTDAGTEFYAKVYHIDAAGDFIYMGESDLVLTTSGNIGTVVSVSLQNPIPLTAGQSYLIVAAFDGAGGAGDFIVGTAGVSEAQTSFFYRASNTTWYYVTATPMVRFNFNPDVNSGAGLEEATLAFGLNLSPNPANEQVNINFNMPASAQADVKILDLAGKVVFAKLQSFNAGQQTLQVNTTDFQAGVYMVSLSANGTTSLCKLVVR